MLRFVLIVETNRMGTPEARMNISPFLSVNQSFDETLQWTKDQLLLSGLRPVQTFDLHAARAGMHDCPCPNHGTNECDCQMVIVLVYGKTEQPVTLILHGNDGQTWLSVADSPHQRSDTKLSAEIRGALEKVHFSYSIIITNEND
jgi:hypothetical protein